MTFLTNTNLYRGDKYELEDKNLFEILGVEFDPPDNIKKIKAVFEQWKKNLTAEQNTTVDAQRLNEVKRELSLSYEFEKLINDPANLKMQAASLKNKRVEQLKSYIILLCDDDGSMRQVTRAQMKKVSEKLHLSLSTVESTYKKMSFEIKNPRNKTSIIKRLNEFFMSDNVMDDLRKNFDDFNMMTDFNRYPWAASVRNLYDLACKIDRSGTIASSYRYMNTGELSEIFRMEAQEIAEPIPLWQSIKNILNIAQMQIFDCNENRYRYDHSLHFETESMNKFFNDLKAAPEIFKRDDNFAEHCIERIEKNLPNVANKYELAISLYNKYAGLLNEPYESPTNPAETNYFVECGNCHTSTQYKTREEAYFSKCPMCGENFFVDCPSCHKKIPSASKHCPHCQFSLEEMRNELQKFPKYLVNIEEYLIQLENTKITNDKLKSASLIIDHIDKLIAEARSIKPESSELKSFEERNAKLRKVQEIRKLELWAESKLLSLTNSQDKVVSNCIEVLHEMRKVGIQNYPPAISRLSQIPPKQPASISAVIKEPPPSKRIANSITNKISVNGKAQAEYEEVKLSCSITWQPANDLEVKYQLIRKIGSIPLNNKDGEILIGATDKFEFEDKNVMTGITYGYAIFAIRAGAFSKPVTCEVVHYSDIEEQNLIARTEEDGFCHFSWTLPSKNCLGVRILRTNAENNLIVLADKVQSPFTDRAVKNKSQYNYRLQCVYYSATERDIINEKMLNETSKIKIYHKYEYSEGLSVTLMPESPPIALQNITYRLVNGKVIFHWRSTGDFNVLFREIKNNQLNFDSFKNMNNRIELNRLDNILGSKKLLSKVASKDQTCEFKITEESCRIAIISATHSLGVICDVINIANVQPCAINLNKTSIDGGKLKIILNNLPDKLLKIHYAVTTKNSRDRLYMSVDDAKNNKMRSIFAKKYELDKVIIVHSPPQMELYLTVIGEYKMSDGSIAYSEPSTAVINNRPKAEITYWLEWATSGFLTKTARAKNCKLVIESQAEYTPTLILAYNKNGGTNIELDEQSTVKIKMIPKSDNGILDGHQEFPLDNTIWENISEGTVIKLLPDKNDSQHFEIRPARPDSLKVPPK